MNTNTEIFNYLNLVDKRLGKLYKTSGFNPLPEDFSFSKATIKERLYLNQMPSTISFPDFLYEEKKALKKRFKQTASLIKNILKEGKFKQYMSPAFAKKFELYLVMRREVTSLIIKDFKKEDFDENDAYTEICQIDTIFFDLLEGFFEPGFNFLNILPELEKKYNIYYSERLKLLEQKNNEKIVKNALENSQQMVNNKTKKQENNLKLQKNNLKNEIRREKIQKTKEVLRFKAEVEKRER